MDINENKYNNVTYCCVWSKVTDYRLKVSRQKNNNFYLYSAIKSNRYNCSVAVYKNNIKINVNVKNSKLKINII